MYKRLEIGDYLIIFKIYTLDRGVVGIKSICEDGKHVLFIDVDNVNAKWLGDRVREMIKHFRISDVFILKSSKDSFFLVCLDKFTKGEIIDVQSWFDDVITKTYQMYGLRRNGWVIRSSEKMKSFKDVPKFLGKIPSRFSNRKQSSAHAEILKNYFNVHQALIRLKRPDKLYKFHTDTYPTIIKR